jgi:hypothetical protein
MIIDTIEPSLVGVAMNKSVRFAAMFAFLCSGSSIAVAAGDGGWVTCKDGLQVRGERACDVHGGVVLAKSSSNSPLPIDTRQPLSPNATPGKSASIKKSQAQKVVASATTKKKATNTRNTPTAKCMDGAMYYSTQRRGACAKHGGVRSWYI